MGWTPRRFARLVTTQRQSGDDSSSSSEPDALDSDGTLARPIEVDQHDRLPLAEHHLSTAHGDAPERWGGRGGLGGVGKWRARGGKGRNEHGRRIHWVAAVGDGEVKHAPGTRGWAAGSAAVRRTEAGG